jgi:hypothetical protein
LDQRRNPITVILISLFASLSPETDPPQVTLSLGSTLNPDDIKEGDDVYFECHIKANPKEHRITWSHDVSVQLFVDLDSLSLDPGLIK